MKGGTYGCPFFFGGIDRYGTIDVSPKGTTTTKPKPTMNHTQMLEALNIPAGYEKPKVAYPDGNAFAIFASVTKAVRKVDPDLAKRYSSLMMQSDSYETVIATAASLVDFN